MRIGHDGRVPSGIKFNFQLFNLLLMGPVQGISDAQKGA